MSDEAPSPEHQEVDRSILDLAFDAFVAIDPQGLIIDWNSKAEAMFGWSRTEALGQSALILAPERDRHAFESALRSDQSLLTTCIRRGGTEFPAELAIARTPESLISFVRDLTGPIQLEEALRRAEDHQSILNSLEDGYTE